MTIATITPEYQTVLELHRMHPEDEHLQHLLDETWNRLWIAWLRYRWSM